MIDHDAHKKILAWAVASGRMSYREYNFLMHSVGRYEWRSSQCVGKERFRDIGSAMKIAHKSSHRNDLGMVPYYCKFCGNWHIGQKSPKFAHIAKLKKRPDRIQ